MAQETNYPNNVIAQLIAIRQLLEDSGIGEGGASKEVDLSGVIEAINNIKLQADTINLNTDDLETLLGEVKTILSNNHTEIKSADATQREAIITAIESSCADVIAMFTVEGEDGETTNLIAEINEAIKTNISSLLTDVKTNTAGITTAVESVKNSIDTIKTSTDGVKTAVETLNEDNAERHTNLIETVEDIGTSVDTLKTDIDNRDDARIVLLNTLAGNLVSKLGEIKTADGTNTEAINAKIAEVISSLTTNGEAVDGNFTDLTELLTNKFRDLQLLLEAIKNKDDVNEELLDAINNIKLVADSISLNADTINLNTDEVEALLNSLKSAIGTYEGAEDGGSMRGLLLKTYDLINTGIKPLLTIVSTKSSQLDKLEAIAKYLGEQGVESDNSNTVRGYLKSILDNLAAIKPSLIQNIGGSDTGIMEYLEYFDEKFGFPLESVVPDVSGKIREQLKAIGTSTQNTKTSITELANLIGLALGENLNSNKTGTVREQLAKIIEDITLSDTFKSDIQKQMEQGGIPMNLLNLLQYYFVSLGYGEDSTTLKSQITSISNNLVNIMTKTNAIVTKFDTLLDKMDNLIIAIGGDVVTKDEVLAALNSEDGDNIVTKYVDFQGGSGNSNA